MLRVIPQSLKKAVSFGHITLSTIGSAATLLLSKKRGNLNRESAEAVYKPWALDNLERIGAKINVEGTPPTEPCILVGNHVSYLDIPLMWATTDAVFVSKVEVRKWPVIGTAAEALGTIFVTRSSYASRAETSKKITAGVLEQKNIICIFPEGTSGIEGTEWKRGVFKIAEKNNIKIHPFRIFYTPSRPAAFVGNDALLPHAWNLMNYAPFQVSIKFFEPVTITDANQDTQVIQNIVQQSVRECLEKEKAEASQ